MFCNEFCQYAGTSDIGIRRVGVLKILLKDPHLVSIATWLIDNEVKKAAKVTPGL